MKVIIPFIAWLIVQVFQHDKRISELERIGPKDMETLRLKINEDVANRTDQRFTEILAELKSLQRSVIELKVRQETQRTVAGN